MTLHEFFGSSLSGRIIVADRIVSALRQREGGKEREREGGREKERERDREREGERGDRREINGLVIEQ